jgi:hypothetical protein
VKTKTLKRKTVSLSDELFELERAIEGARLMLDMLANEGMPTEYAETVAPSAIAAGLSLVVARLHHLGRVVRGGEDPRHVWAPHNDSIGLHPDDADVRLTAWPWPHELKRKKSKP